VTSARIRRRRGRTRKIADRHPCGKIIQKANEEERTKPNEAVVRMRRTLLPGGDITKAENWPDLCLARGWITEERHRAFSTYLALYEAAGVGLPRCKTFDPDRVRSHDSSAGNAKAQRRLRDIWAALSPRRAQILFSATQGWPPFVMWMLKRGHVPSPFDIHRDNLFCALDTVEAIMSRSLPQDVVAA
jgi:hypothetical protein